MTLNMLVFDLREVEKPFFENNKFDNFNIMFYSDSLTPELVKTIPQEVLDNTNIISVFINSIVDEEVINSFKNLRIISTRSTGYNHINLAACKNKNIDVINVENYGSTSIAQYTFGLIIALVRRIIPAYLHVKNCSGSDSNFNGRDVDKLTLGVIGTGAIGGAVCRLAKGFGMRVLAYDKVHKTELTDNEIVEYAEMDELLKNSDIVTLHLPYTGENRHMISDFQFNIMKENSYLINTSRGELVDIVALYNNVKNGKLKGAALDVLSCERVSFSCEKLASELDLKCVEEVKYVRKLLEFENVIITPHIAYDTKDAVEYILSETMRSVSDVIQGGKSSKLY